MNSKPLAIVVMCYENQPESDSRKLAMGFKVTYDPTSGDYLVFMRSNSKLTILRTDPEQRELYHADKETNLIVSSFEGVISLFKLWFKRNYTHVVGRFCLIRQSDNAEIFDKELWKHYMGEIKTINEEIREGKKWRKKYTPKMMELFTDYLNILRSSRTKENKQIC